MRTIDDVIAHLDEKILDTIENISDCVGDSHMRSAYDGQLEAFREVKEWIKEDEDE